MKTIAEFHFNLANKDLEDVNLNLNTQLTELKLKLGESQIKERELNLKNEFLKEENEKLHKQIELLHQKLKDQSELNAIKTTRLEEKLKSQQSIEAHSKMNESNDNSMLSYNVPTSLGYGRSQSPRIGNVDRVKQLKKQHRSALKELKSQMDEKDEIIKDLVVEKEEYLIKINELENEVDYLNNQIDIAQKEKEYLHQINLLDNEKRNAEQKLAQLTTPWSPVRMNLGSDEKRRDYREYSTIDRHNKLSSNMKWRSRNPSWSGIKLVNNSIPLRSMRSGALLKDINRSGQLKTLKQLATARNLNWSMMQNNAYDSRKCSLVWADDNIDHINNDNGFTLDSSQTNYLKDNPYKRNKSTKSKTGNTSDGWKGINHISEIHPSSKGQSDDVNGTLMNSIVNLFPNKFRSKQGSGCIPNDQLNNIGSFSSSRHGSLSKQELEEKLQRIKRSRENSNREVSDRSRESNNEEESPIKEATNYVQGHYDQDTTPYLKTINKNWYYEMLETGEIMKNINGDVLWKKWNREFTINQLITDVNHWKIWLRRPLPGHHFQNNKGESNWRISIIYSEEQDEESDEYVEKYVRPDTNEDASPFINQDSIILRNNDWNEAYYQQRSFQENSEESSEDEESEYQELLEEGIPWAPEISCSTSFKNQQKNNRYNCSMQRKEHDICESDEDKSKVWDSSNFVSQPKIFKDDKKNTKAPSMRYFSERNEGQKPSEVINSIKIRGNNQSPMHGSIKNDMSYQINDDKNLDPRMELESNSVKSSVESKNSKCSPYSFSKWENKKQKIWKEGFQNNPSEISVRLFKDITYKVQPENKAKLREYITSSSRNLKEYPRQANTAREFTKKVYLWDNSNELDSWIENEPVGYAQIDLMNDQVQESDSDSLPLEHLNSKLSNIEKAVQFFYTKMHSNYNKCMNEVGTLKDYIEQKTEKKSYSKH